MNYELEAITTSFLTFHSIIPLYRFLPVFKPYDLPESFEGDEYEPYVGHIRVPSRPFEPHPLDQ